MRRNKVGKLIQKTPQFNIPDLCINPFQFWTTTTTAEQSI